MNKTFNLIQSLNSDYFSVNNKIIELENFLFPQKSKLSDQIERIDKTSKNKIGKENKLRLLNMFSDQVRIINALESKIYKTDHSKQIVRMRLDVPRSAEYTCYADSQSGLSNINDVIINGQNYAIQSNLNFNLTEGVHKVEIPYSINGVMSSDLITINSKNKIVNIGKLTQGSYSISFKLEKTNNLSSILLIISKGSLKLKDFESYFIKENEDIVYKDLINPIKYNENEYSKNFVVDQKDLTQDYYVHLITSDKSKDYSQTYLNFKIEHVLNEDDVNFYCYSRGVRNSLSNQSLRVVKKSPVEYTVFLPHNFENRFISFNRSFNLGWEAASIRNGNKHIYSHFQNGYANAWFIDKSDNGVLSIVFTRQSRSEKIAIISLLLFIIMAVIYIFFKFKHKWKN